MLFRCSMVSNVVHIRFRHVCGDIGPFKFPFPSNVQDLRERVFQEWPKAGTLGKDPPASPSELRLILSGRFLDANERLEDLKAAMGDPKADTIVTMHVVIRPAAAAKASGKLSKEEQPGCCSCVVQ